MTDIDLPVCPSTYGELQELIGQELGPTPWYDITQKGIDSFAETTGDHQWIHVDPERAAASPFGSTIAHGLFSLSLSPQFSYQMIDFGRFDRFLNYGYDRVRFPAPVPVGSRIRMRATVVSAVRLPGGIQVKMSQVVEREGADKPVVVIDFLVRVVE